MLYVVEIDDMMIFIGFSLIDELEKVKVFV